MKKKGRIVPYIADGKPGFRVTFYHPVVGKRVSRGLGVREKSAALIIADGLGKLCKCPALTKDEAAHISPEAWRIFHGEEKIFKTEEESLLDIIGSLRSQLKKIELFAVQSNAGIGCCGWCAEIAKMAKVGV